MYVERVKRRRGEKVYEQPLLRESYREKGAPRSAVKHRTLLNLSRYPAQVVDALERALKDPQAVLGEAPPGVCPPLLYEGLSVGAVWAVYGVAKAVGVVEALGGGHDAKLALWQVMARVLEQGSRLSAVRLHEVHALADVVGLERGFDEEDLYANLGWLSEHQAFIEGRLLRHRRGSAPPGLFLYDVTSSYLEGVCNAFGAYGYDRDRKRGKQQIVVGLLCEEEGEPVSVEVFEGNTQDVETFASQVRKAAERFGCVAVTFVGDRGLIKRGQMEELAEAGFHYITALTKPQIEKLLAAGALQMELFDVRVCEVRLGEERLVLRRNPVRAAELAATREDKRGSVVAWVRGQNAYLREHPRAQVDRALARVQEKIARLRVDAWLRAEVGGRTITLRVDEAVRVQESRLDGCYVLRTDLTPEQAQTERVHARYKDLAQVEQGFRISKTGHLELRPIYVRSEKSTRGHVFVVMLAYLIRRALARAWAAFDVTVEEGLGQLKTLCTIRVQVQGRAGLLRIPEPRPQSRALLDALGLSLPPVLPHKPLRVATKKKLPSRRLSQ